jgi:peptidoglycan hydrolase CwlO-like protein
LKLIILIILLNFKIFGQEDDIKELKEKDDNLKKQIYQLEEEQKKINQKIQDLENKKEKKSNPDFTEETKREKANEELFFKLEEEIVFIATKKYC